MPKENNFLPFLIASGLLAGVILFLKKSEAQLCIEGDTKCENNSIYQCVGGIWEQKQNCIFGCAADGKNCASSPPEVNCSLTNPIYNSATREISLDASLSLSQFPISWELIDNLETKRVGFGSENSSGIKAVRILSLPGPRTFALFATDAMGNNASCSINVTV